MKAIVHRQAVVNRLVNNTRPWIVTTPVFELLQNAVYDVRNTSTTTTSPGFIHIPPSGLTIRVNEYDKNYVQHYPTLITLKRGDIINIGSASCTLTASPIYNSPTF
jgi:hypothetical protein